MPLVLSIIKELFLFENTKDIFYPSTEKLVEATGTYESKLTNKSDDGGCEIGAADGVDVEAVKQPPSSGSAELASVQCRLETKELWDKFHELGTEMIITKSGRSVCIRLHFILMYLFTISIQSSILNIIWG